MATWLDADLAKAMVEGTAPTNSTAWSADVDAACAWVEKQRPDLLAGDPGVFTPGADVKLGTAMYALRLYTRRTSSLGVSQNTEWGGSDILRQDPDIAKLLGIGAEGRPVFGGARAAELAALEVAE